MTHDEIIHGFLPIYEVKSKDRHCTLVITGMQRVGLEISEDGESDLLHPTELYLLERKDGVEIFTSLWEEDGADEAKRKESKAKAIKDILANLTKDTVTVSIYGDRLKRFIEDKPFVMNERQQKIFINEGRRHGINIIWNGVKDLQAAGSNDLKERTETIERLRLECTLCASMFTNPNCPGRKNARQN